MQVGLKWIDDRATELIDLASAIWGYAEVGMRETKSAALLAGYLEKQGFTVRWGVGGLPTAFVASYGEGKPIIGFLGEYDALPSLSQKVQTEREPLVAGAPGHGCGHNLLGVGSLGAAVALKEEIQAGGLGATVRYYGCPAEETAIGKVFMAREGAFDDLDAALSWHSGGVNMATGCSSLALNSVRFAFHGRSSHASAAPHMGISALDAVELMNVGVNYLREHVTPEARIHYVITNGGSEPNIVPANAEVWYYIRAPHRYDVEEIYQRIVKIAEGAALMTGARLEVKFQAGLYDILPNPVLIELLEKSMTEVGVPSFTPEEMEFAKGIEASFSPGMKEAAIQGHHLPAEMVDVTLHDQVAACSDRGSTMWASTDVGDVSWIVPTGQVNAASYVFGTPAHSWQAVAAAGMSIGHKSILTAARSLALGGYRLVTDPALLSQAWEAFDKARGSRRYVSPVPADVAPPDPNLDKH